MQTAQCTEADEWLGGWGSWPSLPPIWGGRTPAHSVSAAFETRCPNGKKVIQYKRARLEKWAPYLNNNGLVCRLTTYEDLQCKGAALAAGSRRAGSPNMPRDLGHVTAPLLV